MNDSYSQFLSDDDQAWAKLRDAWAIRSDTTYLNHGSFGPPPLVVQGARRHWQERLDEQPMDFFVRQLEGLLYGARDKLATFVGTQAENLVLVDNATYGMNVVAASVPLSACDEVILNDHEYGAVKRIWQRACERADAKLRVVELGTRIESSEQVVDALASAFTPRTKLLVVSHITSPTAVTMPVNAICERAERAGVPVCIDGPHAIAQVPLALDDLGCAFYTASCHKWLSAPLGSGFLYVHPSWQSQVEPVVLSWGRIDGDGPKGWADEFVWSGTRDASAFLAIPTAIEFLEAVGLDSFRARMHHLAKYVRGRLTEFSKDQPITPDHPRWYTSMGHAPLPPGDARGLQQALWERHRIEVPIIDFGGRRWIRVSCHLYTQRAELDRLIEALRAELAASAALGRARRLKRASWPRPTRSRERDFVGVRLGVIVTSLQDT
jgi:isopenicillin-N epimerase